MLLTASFVVAGLIVFLAIYLGVKTDVLKAPGSSSERPYSFARTQLMWWTVIIGGSFIVLFGKTGNYDVFNQSTLILLSIGMVTTAGASIIDVNQIQKTANRHQDLKCRGLFYDILSDENGISMHRFQALIFNVLFGLTFIVTFWSTDAFPEFNNAELALMGVSSGTYLALKTNENTNTDAMNKAHAQQNPTPPTPTPPPNPTPTPTPSPTPQS